TTLAGSGKKGFSDGFGSQASFDGPTGIAVDDTGTLYVSDMDNRSIRKITPDGIVTTLAGNPSSYKSVDGTGTSATFGVPTGLALGPDGNIYVVDSSSL